MNYQLILQFAATSMVDFDRLVSLETILMERLGEFVSVDGHDFGLGKFNIFIFTDEPTTTFTHAHQVILEIGIPNELQSAYREAMGEDYIILWPSTLTEFDIL
jgi:hypothetical protein